MVTRKKEVDVVVVGLGWTGGILSKELAEAGLKVVALERGAARDTSSDYSLPTIRDELRYVTRHDLMQNTARDTLTVRNNPSQEALPMRRLGSFLPGEVVGGSGVHWSGHTWRWTDMEFKVRSIYEERYGKNFIPTDMTIQYCGYCQRFGCEANAKGSPHMTVIPIAMRNPNFELRANAWVTKVIKDSGGKRVTGVTYTNVLNGEEFEQPAGIVILCAYAINNVHLMLLSGVGQPYDAASQTGVIGKNYCYQTGASATLFFEGKHFNPFINAGGSNATIDDFNTNWNFDRGPHGFLGAYNVAGGFNTVLPIGYRPVPSGTPQWGKAWKAATAKWYQTAMTINASGSVMANRNNYYDLDPTYRNAFGQPLMRMTFDYQANEHKMGQHAAQVVNDIAKSMDPTRINPAVARTQPWTVVPYQSTHNTGGTIMGTNPRESAVNKYLQNWDCHNLFVVGANVFAHNSSYNPTGPVGALAYWTADAIKSRYVKNPGPLVAA